MPTTLKEGCEKGKLEEFTKEHSKDSVKIGAGIILEGLDRVLWR